MPRIIGIDPGARTGLALAENGKLTVCTTLPYDLDGAKVMAWVGNYATRVCIDAVVIEVPAPPIFNRPGQTVRAMRKISRNVGECYQKAKALVGFCRRLQLVTIERPPIKGGTKRGMPAAIWAQLVSWQGRPPSHHARDAAMLALSYNPIMQRLAE